MELYEEISLNYKRLQESRRDEVPTLITMFERRMNNALEEVYQIMGEIALGETDEIAA